MQRKHFWQLVLILFLLAWSVVSLTPLTGRDLILEFRQKARNRDATFTNIMETAATLQAANSNRAYANLKQAVGTNSIENYFPSINAKAAKNPTAFILNRLQREAAGKIRLGLDLQGGTSYLIEMDTSKLATNSDRGAALSHGVEVIRRRVDSLGVAEPIIQPAGNNQILVQLPGLSEADKERARELIQKAAYLEFRMVHPDSPALIAANILEPGYERLTMETRNKEGAKEIKGKDGTVSTIHVKRNLTGAHLKHASITREQLTNKPEIAFELDDEGARLFKDITTEWQPKGDRKFRLAIVLDGELYSAPQINGVIPAGRGVIQGQFDFKEAMDLVNVLQNPLQAPVIIKEERTVEPSFGADTVRKGLHSAVIGTLAVVGFMLIYYMLAGAVANVALLVNIVVLMGTLCAIETTLTMPGIAGIVLTIGMAVDANVLIFERIREELAAGKTMRGALAAGYDKAFGTIFDSHLTTLIASIILIFMGTGSVKGFGVTLSIGVALSLFTALIVTRLIFDFMLAKGWLKTIKMLHLIRETKIDFMRWAKPAFIASWLLILVGNGYGIFIRGSDVLGVEFSGGDEMTLSFRQKVGQEKISAAIRTLHLGEPIVQYQKDVLAQKETLRITTRLVDEKNTNNVPALVLQTLQKQFPEAGFTSGGSVNHIGPSVGAEIQMNAIIASLVAMFFILVYVAFRYEFSFAVAAIVAILHDLMMTAGWFFLTGREMSGPFVAAMLTIIGFSINDTVVIFDRVREDLKLGVRGSFKELVNHALNRTLSRTLITSGTVFLATMSLYLFGGGVINDFSFTFLIGIITGTYSSIYIAAFIVLRWNKGQRPKIGGTTLEGSASAREPASVRA